MSILLPDEIYQQEDNDFIQSINPQMVLVIKILEVQRDRKRSYKQRFKNCNA